MPESPFAVNALAKIAGYAIFACWTKLSRYYSLGPWPGRLKWGIKMSKHDMTRRISALNRLLGRTSEYARKWREQGDIAIAEALELQCATYFARITSLSQARARQ